jgi:hypothetical protein
MGILRTDKVSGLETPTAVTGSVAFDGNDHLSIGSAGDFNFLHNALSDWTAEFWVKTGSATRQFAFGTGASSAQVGFSIVVMSTDDNQSDGTAVYAQFGRGSAGNYRYWGSNGGLTVNTWHHVAAVFKSSDKTLVLYVDGIEVDSGTGTANGTFATTDYSTSNSSYAFLVAKNEHADEYLTGEISNLRVVNGRRLYTSDFTPPVHALETINGTRILCCNNPDSVTAVSNAGIGTAHTATASGDPTVSTDNPSLTRDFTGGTEFSGVTVFDTQGYFVPPSGTTEQRGRGRGIFSAGTSPNDNTSTNNIDYITIATSGNVQDFGDLDESRQATSGGSDSTRGLFSGGSSTVSPSGNRNTISYITIAATGNAVNFGDLSGLKRYTGSTSDKTRTVIAGGANAPGPLTDIIEYVTTQSLGDVTTFGDLISATWAFVGTASSPTRGIYFGGSTSTSSSDSVNTIVYVTIQTLGDALDFGDLTNVNAYTGPGGIVSSTTRGIRGGGGGANPFARVNTIDYVTMASTGNAQDFGDLSYAPNGAMGCSSLTRGIFAGGKNSSGSFNTIDYVTIASTGNAQDFGDMRGTYAFGSALSDCHGGIS